MGERAVGDGSLMDADANAEEYIADYCGEDTTDEEKRRIRELWPDLRAITIMRNEEMKKKHGGL